VADGGHHPRSTWLPPSFAAKQTAVAPLEEAPPPPPMPSQDDAGPKAMATQTNKSELAETRRNLMTPKSPFTKYVYKSTRLPEVELRLQNTFSKAVPIVYAPNALDGQNRQMEARVRAAAAAATTTAAAAAATRGR
jgi:hypothetical protein